jgi:hypothetical protein
VCVRRIRGVRPGSARHYGQQVSGVGVTVQDDRLLAGPVQYRQQLGLPGAQRGRLTDLQRLLAFERRQPVTDLLGGRQQPGQRPRVTGQAAMEQAERSPGAARSGRLAGTGRQVRPQADREPGVPVRPWVDSAGGGRDQRAVLPGAEARHRYFPVQPGERIPAREGGEGRDPRRRGEGPGAP